MSRLSGTLPNPHEELYTSAKEFLASASQKSHLETHRERFHARALDADAYSYTSNPLGMAAERAAQKEHFRRLKFKHLEQEAKKSFLFCITGDTPQRVLPGENEELEAENAGKKAGLKAVKDDIERIRGETLQLSKENAHNHAILTEHTSEIAKLQREIRDMELELARIKTAHPPEDRMTVDEAEAKLDAQTAEIERLMAALSDSSAKSDELRALVAAQAKKVLALAREREVQEAKAAAVRRAREAGGTGMRVHDLSQWYESTLNTYRRLIGIRSARAISPSELELEYDIPRGTAVLRLVLEAGVLRDASLRGADVDISEAVTTAVDRNDTPGLIADVLLRLRPL